MIQQALANTMTFGERTAYAGKMLLIGLGTVFIVLALLWGALELFRRFLTAREEGGAEQSTPAPVQIVASAAPPAPVAPAGDDALIAVITAAVAAAMAEENGGAVPGFRVVSFRRL